MFDHVVLTAANESQAHAYRTELAYRGLRPDSRPSASVVPDPGGKRVGSGVSTLLVLAELARARAATSTHAHSLTELFRGRKVCVLHAGGDSRRLPAYAAHGKVFLPMPIEAGDPRRAMLFDLLLDDVEAVTMPAEGGVLIATGDVYLGLAARHVRADRPGITGVAWPETPERGLRHGVYRLDAHGVVTGFLHKATPAQLQEAQAVRSDGRVCIDTGVLVLDPDAAGAWLEQAGVVYAPEAPAEQRVRIEPGVLRDAIERGEPTLDLYGDMLRSIGDGSGAAGIDWSPPNGSLTASVIRECPFLHIGSTAELLDAMTREAAPAPNWRPAGASRVRVCHTRGPVDPTRIGLRVLIEGCELDAPPELAGDNVLVGVPAGMGRAVSLPREWGLVCLPVSASHAEPAPDSEGAWVALCFGVRDDFKTTLASGGTFGNARLNSWSVRWGVGDDAVWPDVSPEEQTLWTARLWTPVDTPASMLETVEWMWRERRPPDSWLSAERWSAAEVMARVDHARLLAARDRVLGHGG